MTSIDFTARAKDAVLAASNAAAQEVRPDDLYVVWFSKTLQNWKALVSTDILSGYYWEVTHNGDKGETYVDEYRKQQNTVVSD